MHSRDNCNTNQKSQSIRQLTEFISQVKCKGQRWPLMQDMATASDLTPFAPCTPNFNVDCFSVSVAVLRCKPCFATCEIISVETPIQWKPPKTKTTLKLGGTRVQDPASTSIKQMSSTICLMMRVSFYLRNKFRHQ